MREYLVSFNDYGLRQEPIFRKARRIAYSNFRLSFRLIFGKGEIAAQK